MVYAWRRSNGDPACLSPAKRSEGIPASCLAGTSLLVARISCAAKGAFVFRSTLRGLLQLQTTRITLVNIQFDHWSGAILTNRFQTDEPANSFDIFLNIAPSGRFA